jgi:hypothetical protein
VHLYGLISYPWDLSDETLKNLYGKKNIKTLTKEIRKKIFNIVAELSKNNCLEAGIENFQMTSVRSKRN